MNVRITVHIVRTVLASIYFIYLFFSLMVNCTVVSHPLHSTQKKALVMRQLHVVSLRLDEASASAVFIREVCGVGLSVWRN